MAMTDAAKEGQWLRNLTEELGDSTDSTRLYINNQGSGCLSEGEGLHRRTKHIDAKHHFICDCIKTRKINISYVPTAEILADVLTKPLGKTEHQQALKILGLV